MGPPRWALTQGPDLLVQLESRSLKVLDDPLGELVAGIVSGMLSKELAEEAAAARRGEADREHELHADQGLNLQVRQYRCSEGAYVLPPPGAPL